jgi:putative transposase
MSYTNLLTHIVFSTKERYPFLTDERTRQDIHSYLGGIVRNLRGKALAVGGVADHVHMLVSFPPAIATADAIRTIKSSSSLWIHDTWRELSKFKWQVKYAGFSVSPSAIPRVTRYIIGQEAHHRKRTFQEELIQLLDLNGVEYDPRYLWRD